MSQILNSPKFKFVAIAVLLAALSRLLPHPPNFTAIGGMALFAGAMLPGVFAFAVPLAAMLIADLVLEAIYGYGFHGTMLAVYASLIMMVVIGKAVISKTNIARIAGGSIAASALFFIVTNLAVWLGSSFYPQNVGGLIECYVAAIPFFGNTIAGDLFFSTMLFGSYHLLSSSYPVLKRS
jgi:hypothetical protein